MPAFQDFLRCSRGRVLKPADHAVAFFTNAFSLSRVHAGARCARHFPVWAFLDVWPMSRIKWH